MLPIEGEGAELKTGPLRATPVCTRWPSRRPEKQLWEPASSRDPVSQPRLGHGVWEILGPPGCRPIPRAPLLRRVATFTEHSLEAGPVSSSSFI